MNKGYSFPTKKLNIVGLLVSVTTVVGIILLGFILISVKETFTKFVNLSRSKESIILNFEKQSHIVLIGTQSGEIAWESKYYEADKLLDQELAKIIPQLGKSEVQGLIAARGNYENDLHSSDQQIFNLIRSHKIKEAKQLLTSSERNKYRDDFLSLVNAFTRTIEHDLNQEVNKLSYNLVFLAGIFFSLCLIMVGLYFVALRIVKQWNFVISNYASDLDRNVNEKVEELKKERAKLEFASKMSSIGEMAGNIGHEINNPLAVISGYTERLQRYLEKDDFDRDKAKSAVNIILSTVARISTIITGLKKFARDADNEKFEDVTIQHIIDETLIFTDFRFKNAGIPIEVLRPEQPIVVHCQPVQIQQILINLLNNAFDAICEESERWVKLVVKEEASNLICLISNSGPRIPEDIVSKIMTPYFTTKPKGKGTGIGLTISRDIAKKHGGILFVDTQQEHTCFVLKISKNVSLESHPPSLS